MLNGGGSNTAGRQTACGEGGIAQENIESITVKIIAYKS
jgi:hypothetical protein